MQRVQGQNQRGLGAHQTERYKAEMYKAHKRCSETKVILELAMEKEAYKARDKVNPDMPCLATLPSGLRPVLLPAGQYVPRSWPGADYNALFRGANCMAPTPLLPRKWSCLTLTWLGEAFSTQPVFF
jgi:hypothetical protein